MITMINQERRAWGVLPEPSEMPKSRCEAGVGTRRVTKDWRAEACVDFAEHSVAISTGFYAYPLGHRFLLLGLTGTKV